MINVACLNMLFFKVAMKFFNEAESKMALGTGLNNIQITNFKSPHSPQVLMAGC